jgi:hypothetical protein
MKHDHTPTTLSAVLQPLKGWLGSTAQVVFREEKDLCYICLY